METTCLRCRWCAGPAGSLEGATTRAFLVAAGLGVTFAQRLQGRWAVAIAMAWGLGWIAVGDPAEILPPEAHERIWEIQKALDNLVQGRTTIAIAHRLSTAQAADEVIVVDRGRVVQRGPHADLVREEDSVYGRLYASWLEQTR